MLAPPALATIRHSFFLMQETRSDNLRPFQKWTGVLERKSLQDEWPDDACGSHKFHPCAIKSWRKLLETLRNKPLRDQIEAVNNWGNDHPYIVDQLNWGMEDYWETPNEFMAISGDCEDYAIAKYYSLRALGVSEDKMRIMIVQDFNLGGIIHAVLGVYVDDELLILDNQIKQVMPALNIYHYRPIYGVNETWWWAYTPIN
ncbi:MAG: transglutaminase-like cysteine peptidase [Alphaproteobacteria bacterium]|nr:transglutaminase-like cysteine peptidase [Alphaproteobacteria bacterium]